MVYVIVSIVLWLVMILLLLRWFHISAQMRDEQDAKIHREFEDRQRYYRKPKYRKGL